MTSKTEKSLSEIPSDLGVSHSRDENSVATGKHKLFFADRYIGSFDAHEVGVLIREYLRRSHNDRA